MSLGCSVNDLESVQTNIHWNWAFDLDWSYRGSDHMVIEVQVHLVEDQKLVQIVGTFILHIQVQFPDTKSHT